MISYGLGDLYQKLKEMEERLRESERRIVDYTITNSNPVKEVADQLIKDYKKLKQEYHDWMTKKVYESKDGF